MKESDKRLTQLLKLVEPDKPSTDFTVDVMQMITESSIVEESLVSIDAHLKIEKAPMHMTDLVIEEIISKSEKSYSLINIEEIKKAALVLFAGMCISIMLWLNADIQFKPEFDQNVDTIIFITFSMLVAGTVLWSLDRWLRKRYLRIN